MLVLPIILFYEQSLTLIIDEYIDKTGNHRFIELSQQGKVFSLLHGNDSKSIDPKALPLLFKRYGYEIDPTIDVSPEKLLVSDLGALGKFRFKSPVDADARDYLVWDKQNEPTMTALARQITAGLCFFANLSIDHPHFCKQP